MAKNVWFFFFKLWQKQTKKIKEEPGDQSQSNAALNSSFSIPQMPESLIKILEMWTFCN